MLLLTPVKNSFLGYINGRLFIPMYLPLKFYNTNNRSVNEYHVIIPKGKNIEKYFVGENNIKDWGNKYEKELNEVSIAHIFNDVFCTYNDILNKGKGIIKEINNNKFILGLTNKDIISNEATRECELFREYTDNNQNISSELYKYGLRCDLNKFISRIENNNILYYLIYKLSDYRKHIAYSMPTIIEYDKGLFVDTLTLQKQLKSNLRMKKLRSKIRSSNLLMHNKLTLKHLIMLIMKYAKLQIEHFVKYSFINTHYLYNFNHEVIEPLYFKGVAPAYIYVEIPRRKNIVKLTKNKKLHDTIEIPFFKSEFTNLVIEIKKLNLSFAEGKSI